MDILIGTNNEGKLRQFKRIFEKSSKEIRVFSLSDLNIQDDVEEDADNLLDNARKKAKYYAEKSGKITLADDTGLFVDALNGEPGIHSKRWCEGSDKERNEKLLARLKNVPEKERTCRYVGVVATYNPQNGKSWETEEKMEGTISDDFRGENGFGYDQIFEVKGCLGKHLAELSGEEKDQISHRGKGVRKFVKNLDNII